MKQFIVYRRVSTKRQSDEGYSLEGQTRAIEAWLKAQPFEHKVLLDVCEAESGGNDDRPLLKQCIELAHTTGATILISRIDRIARSLKLLIMLNEARVSFTSIDMPECDSFTAKLLMLVAERERELAGLRVRATLSVLKSKGVKLGSPSPRIGWSKAIASIQGNAESFAREAYKHIQDIRAGGVTSIYKVCEYLNLRGVRTARGKRWNITAVQRVISKIEQKA